MSPASYNGDDIYCDLIIPRKIDIRIVEETTNVLAFYHTKPFWPVHVVVVPKRHVLSLLELDSEPTGLSEELWRIVTKVAAQVEAETGACRVLTHIGAYQDSKHLHVHVSSGSPLNKP